MRLSIRDDVFYTTRPLRTWQNTYLFIASKTAECVDFSSDTKWLCQYNYIIWLQRNDSQPYFRPLWLSLHSLFIHCEHLELNKACIRSYCPIYPSDSSLWSDSVLIMSHRYLCLRSSSVWYEHRFYLTSKWAIDAIIFPQRQNTTTKWACVTEQFFSQQTTSSSWQSLPSSVFISLSPSRFHSGYLKPTYPPDLLTRTTISEYIHVHLIHWMYWKQTKWRASNVLLIEMKWIMHAGEPASVCERTREMKAAFLCLCAVRE